MHNSKIEDLKLSEWANSLLDLNDVTSIGPLNTPLKTAYLQPVVDTFGSNSIGVLTSPIIFREAFTLGANYLASRVAACAVLTGKPFPNGQNLPSGVEFGPDVINFAQELLAGKSGSPMVVSIEPDAIWKPFSGNDGGIAILLHQMQSQLVFAWTAFEAMVTDLWIVAVNNQPNILARLAGYAKRIEKMATGAFKDDDQEEKQKQLVEKGRAVSLNEIGKLTEHGYDLSSKMGNLLSSSSGMKFSTLEGIRRAYSLAFYEKEQKARTDRIDNALANTGLDELSAVRNLIIHRAGKADDEYEKRAKCLPRLPKLEKNDEIQLNGELCRMLTKSFITCSIALINGVDDWLALTRPTPPS